MPGLVLSNANRKWVVIQRSEEAETLVLGHPTSF